MNPKSRSIKNLLRRKAYQEAREIVLIVCEGGKTEPDYFKLFRNELRLSSVEVDICGKECGSAPISVVDFAISKKAEAFISSIRLPYDSIWCIIDVEAPTRHNSLKRARDKAKSNSLRMILSNPCFEYWYLLHFRKTSAAMNKNKDVIKALKRYIRSYKKNDSSTFLKVYTLTDRAIMNAKAVIREKHWGQNLIECNPSTHIHHIVKHLRQIAKRPRRKP